MDAVALPFVPTPTPLPIRNGRPVNAMSVDVEEHFQVQALSGQVPRAAWEHKTSRVEDSTGRVLDLFAAHGIAATFFTLGWVAERHPTLIRRIVAEGHELASHGYEHARADSQSPQAFHADVSRTKKILEDLGGVAVRGYRAATFSIGRQNLWAFDELAKAGYSYSSSVNPIRHDLYGMEEAPRFPFRPRAGSDLIEVPISTFRARDRNYPCGGGGFFRLLPYAYSRWAIARVNRADRWPTVFYFHPWEIDADQPREPGLPLKSRLRHYVNLERMQGRLERLLTDFAWDRMDRIFLPAGNTP
jgi:polysaccharide deacetylase family protein (PEP-CTERM system associated)